jgi:tetratricopeptide (TPR) repeat protein
MQKTLIQSKILGFLESKAKIFVAIGVIFVVVFAVLFFCCFGCHKKEIESSEKLSAAYMAFGQGDRQKGIDLLDETITKFSKMPAAYQARLIKADVLTDLKNYDEALKVLNETLNFGKPDIIKPLASARIIFVYDSKKDYSNAIDASKRFIDKYPDHFLVRDIYLNLAEYYFLSGSKDEALKVFNEVIINFPATKEAEKAQIRINEIK